MCALIGVYEFIVMKKKSQFMIISAGRIMGLEMLVHLLELEEKFSLFLLQTLFSKNSVLELLPFFMFGFANIFIFCMQDTPEYSYAVVGCGVYGLSAA